MARLTRKTRKTGKKGSVLSVRSPSAVKSFEKLLTRGPLTLVYINAKWCGACHKFSDEVWNPLTQLKNKSMNLASVDSEMIGKTSLANVPRKFYPTLLLVGKDGKAATFKDENGQDTNAMPRNNTLSEDKVAFTNLVQSPANSSISSRPNTPYPRTMNNRSNSNMLSSQLNRRNSPPRELNTPVNISNLAKSPFGEPNMNENPSMFNEEVSRTIASNPIMVPDVGADLVASQRRATMKKSTMTGGKMLKAIRSKTASLKAMLRMRKRTTRRHR